MTKQIKFENNKLFIILIGKICSLEDYKALRAISDDIKQNTKFVIIDLSRVTFTSSEGLGLFVHLYKTFKTGHIAFYLFSPRGEIQEAVELSGLDLIMPIVNTEEELQDQLNLK